MNLNQVTLPVFDMQAAVDFYLTLGFTQIVDTPHYARFACPEGGATFSLCLESKSTEGKTLEEQSLEEKSYRTNGAVIYFEHAELDAWVEELEKKGIVFEQEPTDMSYLWREAILFDPSNNKIKLYWAGENRLNPPWRVDITK